MKSFQTIAVFIVSFMLLTVITTRAAYVTDQEQKDELSYALRVATQDAAAVMMDSSYLFSEGDDPSGFDVDLQKAMKQFEKSFRANLGSVLSEVTINSSSVTMAGCIGYDGIHAVLADGSFVLPFAYSYAAGDKVYNFNLGNSIQVIDTASTGSDPAAGPAEGLSSEEIELSSLPRNYFDPNLSNYEFRSKVIIEAVSDFLNLYFNDESVLSVQSSGIEFTFDPVDKTSASSKMVMTKFSSIIDGPTFFAIVDAFDAKTGSCTRIMSLGAAELKSIY